MEDLTNAVKKPTKKEAAASKKRASPVTWDKLKDAPGRNIPFPSSGNLTAVELITFLPNTLKSWDIIERFISNGANVPTLSYILNTQRTMPFGEMVHNSMLRTMQFQAQMRPEPRYKDWSVRRHVRPEGWDERVVGLGVGGYQTQVQTHPGNRKGMNDVSPPILFKDLGKGVEKMPTGFDALDLTRCVEYHQAHPGEQWYYPDHFEELVKHLGGPAAVTDDHLDSRAWVRWAERRKGGSAASLWTRPAEHKSSLGEFDTAMRTPAKDANHADEDGADSEGDRQLLELAASPGKPAVVGKVVSDKDKVVKERMRISHLVHEQEPDENIEEDFRTAMKYARSGGRLPMDSEKEELLESWSTWKKHGSRGVLAMPLFKKQKRG